MVMVGLKKLYGLLGLYANGYHGQQLEFKNLFICYYYVVFNHFIFPMPAQSLQVRPAPYEGYGLRRSLTTGVHVVGR